MSFQDCVSSGTKITLIDGNNENIENIKIGDDILAYDFNNKRVMFGKVTNITKSKCTKAHEVTTKNTKIIVGSGHSFFVSEEASIKVIEELQVGDDILFFDSFHGIKEKILGKKDLNVNEDFFHITISDYGNYIANDLIVCHNKI